MRGENKVTCVCVNTNVQEALSASKRKHIFLSICARMRVLVCGQILGAGGSMFVRMSLSLCVLTNDGRVAMTYLHRRETTLSDG